MRTHIARFVVVGMLLVSPAATFLACDREDVKDVKEEVNDADRQIDKIDTDGKDD